MLNRRFLIAAVLTVAVAVPVSAQEKWIVVASTTSTRDSGLFGHILPLFKQKTGIDVEGDRPRNRAGPRNCETGDADVVFVHAKAQEEKFITDGFGVKRYPVMYNDFVLIGPKDDPAGVKGERRSRLPLRGSRTRARPSYRAATNRAPILPSSISGRLPVSISRTRAPGTRKSDKAWERRSTLPLR